MNLCHTNIIRIYQTPTIVTFGHLSGRLSGLLSGRLRGRLANQLENETRKGVDETHQGNFVSCFSCIEFETLDLRSDFVFYFSLDPLRFSLMRETTVRGPS